MTSKYLMNHTLLRIKDPKVTLDFYRVHFGMSKLHETALPDATQFFLGFDSPNALNGKRPLTQREGVLSFLHIHGSESDADFKINNGNVEPYRGFGHIEEACAKLESDGVQFKKRLVDGRQKDIAFALDPDGYWIELIRNPAVEQVSNIKADWSLGRMNHSMIRVRNHGQSLDFYRKTPGMTLMRTSEHANAQFTLYFLAYNKDPNFVEDSGVGTFDREAIIELTHNWGTETQSGFAYHTGNTEPKGFVRFDISVPDLAEATNRLQSLGVKVHNNTFHDPDGYELVFVQQ